MEMVRRQSDRARLEGDGSCLPIERGDTLIELLLAITILSLVVAAVFNVLIETSSASREHRSLTSLDAVLKTYSESAAYDIQLDRSAPEYTECAVATPSTRTVPATYHLVSTPSPPLGPPTSYATVFVTGFTPNSAVSVSLGGNSASLAPDSMTKTNANGDATLTFQVPTIAGVSKQLYPVTVADTGTPSITASSPANFSYDTGAPIQSTYPLNRDTVYIKELDWWNGTTNVFEPSSGVCGTQYESGIQLLTVVANAPDGSSALVGFTVTNPGSAPPRFTNSPSTTFTFGSPGSFQFTATGQPTPSYSTASPLPTGVTLSGSGLLSGTPTQSGSFPLTVAASNAGGSSTQNFTLTVNQAPAFTSANTATFVVAQPGTFNVTATGYPTTMTYTVTSGNPPTGVTLAPTGLMSGTATSAGTYNFTITASNGVNPSATQDFTLTVGQAPSITSSSSSTATAGTPWSFQVQAQGYPAQFTYAVSGQPRFVNIDATTGVLSASPGNGDRKTYNFTITVSNGVDPAATQSFTLTVN